MVYFNPESKDMIPYLIDIGKRVKQGNSQDTIDKRVEGIPPSEEQDNRLYRNDSLRSYNIANLTKEYLDRLWKAKIDFTNRNDKVLEMMPRQWMGGILGYTYLFSNKMARRDDLFGKEAEMVDIHEANHTTDEYETRVITDSMLLIKRPRYLI